MQDELAKAYNCGLQLGEQVDNLTVPILLEALTFCDTIAEVAAFVKGVDAARSN